MSFHFTPNQSKLIFRETTGDSSKCWPPSFLGADRDDDSNE